MSRRHIPLGDRFEVEYVEGLLRVGNETVKLARCAAASLGMIPIASEVFWGPMAYAIIGGLFVATLLTLLFLPALYVAWFRIKEPRKESEVSLGEPAPAIQGSPRPA
jgi:hypothetical protein